MVVADHTKLVPMLGTGAAVPVEVTPFGVASTLARLASHGEPAIRADGDRPYVTDNGNLVVDLATGPIADPGCAGRHAAGGARGARHRAVRRHGRSGDRRRPRRACHPDGSLTVRPRREPRGQPSNQGWARSNWPASWNNVASSPPRAMKCDPMGRPAALRWSGTVIAGNPLKLATGVYGT